MPTMNQPSRNPPKSSGPMGVVNNSGGDKHQYLGHFRQSGVLQRGHNLGPVGGGYTSTVPQRSTVMPALPTPQSVAAPAARPRVPQLPTAPKPATPPTLTKMAPKMTPMGRTTSGGTGARPNLSQATPVARQGVTPSTPVKAKLAKAVSGVRQVRSNIRQTMTKEKGGMRTPMKRGRRGLAGLV